MRAADAPVRVSQYSVTSSRTRSLEISSNGLSSVSDHAANLSRIQARSPTGESTSA
ncbi:hypothetical protein SMD44_00447 [Streptomyces alboflavus]|uniref:Uncharacterized protein n=1 Tax=Streptomyces alboflavus TaxID=67267 RepID=A0A1Z1W3T1_9ACTN|nr:hypothetical protein SMD44_00447 [Streptomyces alboflavus]